MASKESTAARQDRPGFHKVFHRAFSTALSTARGIVLSVSAHKNDGYSVITAQSA
jgi:hypothetical protein